MTIQIAHPRGSFRFTRGTSFFAGGVVAERGYDIVRVRLLRPVPLAAGFERIAEYMHRQGRPLQALCGLELRTPRQYPTRDAFQAFNEEYVDRLRRLDLLVEGLVPLTRANLAVVDDAVHEQCVYAFMYTSPSAGAAWTFATSAYAEVARLGDGRIEVVAADDSSPRGMAMKVTFVVHQVVDQLRALGVSAVDATHVTAYTVQAIGPHIGELIVPAVRAAARHGVTWHFARPPVAGLEFELEVRAVCADVVIDLDGVRPHHRLDSRG